MNVAKGKTKYLQMNYGMEMPSLLLLINLTERLSVDTRGHSLSGQDYAQDSYYPVSGSVSSVMIA